MQIQDINNKTFYSIIFKLYFARALIVVFVYCFSIIRTKQFHCMNCSVLKNIIDQLRMYKLVDYIKKKTYLL